MSKSLSKLFPLFLLIVLLLPLVANAAVVCPSQDCPGGKVCIKNPLCAQNFTELLNAIINFIFYLAIAIAPIMIIIAGFYFVTAAGEPAKIKTAKDIILWTLVGLLIVMASKGIIALFGEIFGVKTPYNP